MSHLSYQFLQLWGTVLCWQPVVIHFIKMCLIVTRQVLVFLVYSLIFNIWPFKFHIPAALVEALFSLNASCRVIYTLQVKRMHVYFRTAVFLSINSQSPSSDPFVSFFISRINNNVILYICQVNTSSSIFQSKVLCVLLSCLPSLIQIIRIFSYEICFNSIQWHIPRHSTWFFMRFFNENYI